MSGIISLNSIKIKRIEMNKKEFVKAVSAEGGLSLSDATRAVEAMIEVVTYAMSKSEKIVLNGFGTFRIKERKAHSGCNPRTGEVIRICARRVVNFRPGIYLATAANRKGIMVN